MKKRIIALTAGATLLVCAGLFWFWREPAQALVPGTRNAVAVEKIRKRPVAETRKNYCEIYGSEDFYFDYGDCRFIALNCTEIKPNKIGGQDQLYRLGWRRLRRLKKLLKDKAARHKFVFFHVPPVFSPGAFAERKLPGGAERAYFERVKGLVNSRKVLAVLDKHKPKIVFCGHAHYYANYVKNGVRYIISGGGGGRIRKASRKEFPPREGGFHHAVRVRVERDGSYSGDVVRSDGVDPRYHFEGR